jgi:aspartate/methionine/tyrosine aminotransferase
MEYAKLRSAAKYNLATSGVAGFPLSEFPVKVGDLEINGPTVYGYAPLQRALAEHTGAPEDCIVAAIGTSLANHLALAAVAEPGDEILIEEPTYELITSTAEFLQLKIRTFPRSFEEGFRLDPKVVERNITRQTRAVVLCNLHNPSGVLTSDDTLREVGEIARSVGARMLVDEVYLDAAFDLKPRSSFHLSPRDFVVTSSLTKVYGLSGLRCGWILAEPELAHRIWRINDLFGSIPAHPAELLSVIALQHLDRPRERARTILQKNRAALKALLTSRDDLEYVWSDYGTTCFPRPKHGTIEQLDGILRERYETSVVPGRFFGMPQHFRIGLGGDPDMTAEGLRRLGKALDDLAAS